MKTPNKIWAIAWLLLISLNSFATIGNDKTLFVDNFGKSIFKVDENNDTIFEREDSLLNYVKREGYTTLILRKLTDIKVSSSVYLLPDDTTNLTSPDTALENHLARFIHRAKTSYGVLHVASGSNPYVKIGATYSYVNRHFKNINEFNKRALANFGNSSYCFDMIMGEQDYWNAGNPFSGTTIINNWSTCYLPGLRYMYKNVKTVSNQSGYNPLAITTYIGDLTNLADTSVSGHITEQAQADSIDKYTDIIYIDFYLDGNKMNKINSLDGSLNIFRYDKRKGYRMVLFARNTKASYIVPLFNAQASADTVNSNYLGNNLINQNGLCFNRDTSSGIWRRSINGTKDFFDSLFTNKINPYNLSSSAFIDITKTLEQLTVTKEFKYKILWR